MKKLVFLFSLVLLGALGAQADVKFEFVIQDAPGTGLHQFEGIQEELEKVNEILGPIFDHDALVRVGLSFDDEESDVTPEEATITLSTSINKETRLKDFFSGETRILPVAKRILTNSKAPEGQYDINFKVFINEKWWRNHKSNFHLSLTAEILDELGLEFSADGLEDFIKIAPDIKKFLAAYESNYVKALERIRSPKTPGFKEENAETILAFWDADITLTVEDLCVLDKIVNSAEPAKYFPILPIDKFMVKNESEEDEYFYSSPRILKHFGNPVVFKEDSLEYPYRGLLKGETLASPAEILILEDLGFKIKSHYKVKVGVE